jgi:hypothetical protein
VLPRRGSLAAPQPAAAPTRARSTPPPDLVRGRISGRGGGDAKTSTGRLSWRRKRSTCKGDEQGSHLLRRAQVSAAVPKVYERDGRAAVGRVVGLLQAHMGVD